MIIIALLDKIRVQLSKKYFHKILMKGQIKLTMENSPCDMRVEIERPIWRKRPWLVEKIIYIYFLN